MPHKAVIVPHVAIWVPARDPSSGLGGEWTRTGEARRLGATADKSYRGAARACISRRRHRAAGRERVTGPPQHRQSPMKNLEVKFSLSELEFHCKNLFLVWGKRWGARI